MMRTTSEYKTPPFSVEQKALAMAGELDWFAWPFEPQPTVKHNNIYWNPSGGRYGELMCSLDEAKTTPFIRQWCPFGEESTRFKLDATVLVIESVDFGTLEEFALSRDDLKSWDIIHRPNGMGSNKNPWAWLIKFSIERRSGT